MKSYPFIIQKYTEPVVALDLAKQWLEMDIEGYDGKDDLIEACIKGAVSSVETECNFQLGLSTYEWTTDCRPHEIRDTFYVQSIESISYISNGVTAVFAQPIYQLLRVSKRRSVIIWQDTFTAEQGWYTITFKAGLAEVPDDLLLAVRARVGEYWAGGGDPVKEKRTLSDKLLEPYAIPYTG